MSAARSQLPARVCLRLPVCLSMSVYLLGETDKFTQTHSSGEIKMKKGEIDKLKQTGEGLE